MNGKVDYRSRYILKGYFREFLFLLFKNKQKSASLEPLIGLLAFVVYGLKTTN